tara:strand:- start:534 stop:698 length:165 start_codon:yes stop_codon:yes gene_type:complete
MKKLLLLFFLILTISQQAEIINIQVNQINSADMNQDQAVNVLDVVALVNIIVIQ